jgi:hypothetical protein
MLKNWKAWQKRVAYFLHDSYARYMSVYSLYTIL